MLYTEKLHMQCKLINNFEPVQGSNSDSINSFSFFTFCATSSLVKVAVVLFLKTHCLSEYIGSLMINSS